MVGSGLLEEQIREIAANDSSIKFPGWIEPADIPALLRSAKYLINTSHCYETFGLSLIEAMAVGTIPIVPDHGQMPQISDVPTIGHAFSPSDPDNLRDLLQSLANRPVSEWETRSLAARERYNKLYTPESNLQNLITIYSETIQRYNP